MKKANIEKEGGFFDNLKRKISLAFYNLSVKLSRKKNKPNKSSMNSKRRKQLIFYWSLLVLPILHYIIFYICVNFNSILLAFKKYQYINGKEVFLWGGFMQFKQVFNDFHYGIVLKQMFGNSMAFYAFGLFITMPIALFFSFYIYKKYALSEFFRVILFLPGIISSVVTVFMFQFFINEGVTTIFELIGKNIEPMFGVAKYRMPLVLAYNFLMGFGSNILMYSSAMTSIPDGVTEYAALDGITPLREFFSITLPLIFDTIETFIIVGIAGIFVNQANLYALFSVDAGIEVKTLGYHLFVLTNLGQTEVNFPYAAAMGIIFTVIVLPITLLVRKLMDKFNPNN